MTQVYDLSDYDDEEDSIDIAMATGSIAKQRKEKAELDIDLAEIQKLNDSGLLHVDDVDSSSMRYSAHFTEDDDDNDE